MFFGKGTQPFDFIKHKIIENQPIESNTLFKLMVVWSWFLKTGEIKFFKIRSLDCEQNGKNQYNEGTINRVHCSKC